MPTPIRVGFIGLSSTPSSPYTGAWGQNAHLPYLLTSPKYTLTALCNSSLSSAERAIKLHNLDPSQVRAHGDPVSLAADPNVDMVVCSVNVQQHYHLIKPALQAGKMVFCEWPLASNLEQMKELADLAETKGVKTVVGLQGRFGVYCRVVQSVAAEGKLGKLLSTQMSSYAGILGMAMPKSVAYLMDIRSGGNLLTITAVHREFLFSLPLSLSFSSQVPLPLSLRQFHTRNTKRSSTPLWLFPQTDIPPLPPSLPERQPNTSKPVLDTLTSTLGPLTTSRTLLRNQRPTISLLDEKNSIVDPAHENTTPEHILVQGLISPATDYDHEIPFSFHLRGGPAFQGQPTFDWHVSLERGEIRISGAESLWLGGGVKVEVFDYVSQKVEEIDLKSWGKDGGKDIVSGSEWDMAPVDNVARVYEAFAEGRADRYSDFRGSLKWAEFVAEALQENGF